MSKTLSVAHFAQFAPNACGIFHTAKDLVNAERLVGIDAQFIAYGDKYEGIKTDGNFQTKELEWAYDADVLVRHSAIPTHLQTAGIPIIFAMHGRPESSLRLQQRGTSAVITAFFNKSKDCRYKAFVTFWPEYVEIWSKIIPSKVFYVPSPVNLQEFSPDNAPFDWGENGGQCNVLIADIWREDVTPFNVIFAAAEFAKKYNGKVHIVGLNDDCVSAVKPFLSGIQKDGVLGYVAGQRKNIKAYYRAADIVVTPHVIATRIIRESLASGIPIVAGSGCRYTKHTANPMDIPAFTKAIEDCWNDKKQQPRKVAEAQFGILRTGKAMKNVFKMVFEQKTSSQRKVFIDIGGHLGESIRRFYREMPDAHEYEIYSFEPDIKTFELLDANVGHIKNVNLINACAGITDGMVDFYIGAQNQNEGGTTVEGKQTGDVNYDRSGKVESMDFVRWLKTNINDNDHVVVKMNIEGGEYDLMEAMLAADVTRLIHTMFVQLHAHKFSHGKQRKRFQAIEAAFWESAECKCFFKNKGFYPFYAQQDI